MNFAASLTGAICIISLSAISFFIKKEIFNHKINDQKFLIQRTPIYFTIAIGFLAALFSIFVYFNEFGKNGYIETTLVPVSLAAVAFVFAGIFASYEVLIDDKFIHHGIFGKRKILLDDIKEIIDIRYQGSPRFLIVVRTGRKIGIWSNLLGHDELIATLCTRCQCTYRRLEKNQFH